MKKNPFVQIKYLLFALAILSFSFASAQKHSHKSYICIPVAFYNQENLFDTVDNVNDDQEFLPTGSYKWTNDKYTLKLKHMSEAISQIGGKEGPAILGMAEVENRHVLEDLLSQPALKDKGYRIIHYDSPDRRGIDCALIYKPWIFQVSYSKPHPVVLPGEEYIKTRDVLEVDGTIDDEICSVIVGHWPSRYGGEEVSMKRRMAAAHVMRAVADSILRVHPDAKVIMMGDFNDDPTSPSVEKGLGLKKSAKNLAPNEFFTPMRDLHRHGLGTLAYRDTWNLFDIICVNGNLVSNNPDTLSIYRDSKTGFYAYIFNKPFLTQQNGRYKDYPFRTSAGGIFQGGYSDHFPVYIELVKEIK